MVRLKTNQFRDSLGWGVTPPCLVHRPRLKRESISGGTVGLWLPRPAAKLVHHSVAGNYDFSSTLTITTPSVWGHAGKSGLLVAYLGSLQLRSTVTPNCSDGSCLDSDPDWTFPRSDRRRHVTMFRRTNGTRPPLYCANVVRKNVAVLFLHSLSCSFLGLGMCVNCTDWVGFVTWCDVCFAKSLLQAVVMRMYTKIRWFASTRGADCVN